jgi:hypothetical protein
MRVIGCAPDTSVVNNLVEPDAAIVRHRLLDEVGADGSW